MKLKFESSPGNFIEFDTYYNGPTIMELIDKANEKALINFKIPKYVIMGVNAYVALHEEFGFKELGIRSVLCGLEIVVLDIPDFAPMISCGNGIESISLENIRR